MADTSYLKNYSITRQTLTNANEEYTMTLSTRSTRITISSDDLSSVLLFSFNSGGSATGKRIFQGAEYHSPGVVFGSKSVYVQSSSAGAVCVVEEWESS